MRKSKHRGVDARRDCKLQIANCKLQNEGPRLSPQFAICILRFAICNRFVCLLAIGITALSGMLHQSWAQSKPAADKPVAMVTGEPITRAEFELAFTRVAPASATLTPTERKTLQRELVGVMVDELLFQQFLRKNVPAPDSALIDRRIADLQASLKGKGRTLKDYCEDTGQTDVRLRADLASVVQWNAYVSKQVTDSELKRYYAENRELIDGVMIRVSHIALKVPANGDPKAVQATMQKLRTIRQEIIAGLDFADAAKKYSEVPTAAQGGDLGYFPPKKNDTDPFLRTASSLKVGQVSEVVTTDYGYHLIKVTERKAGKPAAFEEVKEEVRLLWADELRQKIIAEQRKKARIEVNLP